MNSERFIRWNDVVLLSYGARTLTGNVTGSLFRLTSAQCGTILILATKHMSMKRLHRNSHNKIIAGVLSGLADYFGHDPTLYRILAVIFLVLTGLFPGVLLYVVGWVLMPADNESYVVE